MTKIREDIVHFAVRKFLRQSEWQLIAGQYPDGSDDELPPLNILDPVLARDNSPEPRRHSKNKYVPDLVACKNCFMLIIELKPRYSFQDEKKLEILLTDRRRDLLLALNNLFTYRGTILPVPIEEIVFVPCLGFEASAHYSRNPIFCYFKVRGLSSVVFEGNSTISSLD